MAGKRVTRRQFLIFRSVERGAAPFLAEEAVANTALAHPEWDMNEKRSWDDWLNAVEQGLA